MLQKTYLDGVEITSVQIDSLKEALDRIVRRIKSEHPEIAEVILFGSFAEGNYTPYSDIDLALLMEDTNRKFIERQDDFLDYFVEIPFDVNLVVYTKQEVQKMGRNSSHFIQEIQRGIKL